MTLASKPFLARLSGQKGLTLIETVVVLGVFAVVVAAIWIIVAVVQENAKQYQTAQQLQTMVQNTRQLYARINGFYAASGYSAGTDLTATLDSQAAFPVEMRVSQGTANGKINHPWSSSVNGTVTIKVDTTATFDVGYTSLPVKACSSLGTKLSGGEIPGLSSMKINGTAQTLPLTVVTANLACSQSGSTNSIDWIFNLRPQ